MPRRLSDVSFLWSLLAMGMSDKIDTYRACDGTNISEEILHHECNASVKGTKQSWLRLRIVPVDGVHCDMGYSGCCYF